MAGDDNAATQDDNKYYSDDVNAQAVADNNLDSDDFVPTNEAPVTTGNISVGDMDASLTKPDDSVDEENDFVDLVQVDNG